METQPTTRFNDQQLVEFAQELNNIADQQQSIFELKPVLKAQGLDSALKLCQIVYQINAKSTVKYLIFSNLSTFLHPRAPPEFLNSIISQFIPVFMTEQNKAASIGICRCIATSVYHLLNSENFESIFELLKKLEGPAFILFLCELQHILSLAQDVPMLADKNFLILTHVYSAAFPTIIDLFYQSPSQDIYDMIDFLLISFTDASLTQLFSQTSIQEFNVDEFIQNIQNILNTQLPNILSSIQEIMSQNNHTDKVRFLLNFFSIAVKYGLDRDLTAQLILQIYQISIDEKNLESFCSTLKNIFQLYPDLIGVQIIEFLFQMAGVLAQNYDLPNCETVLRIFSLIYATFFEHQNPDVKLPFDPSPIKEKFAVFSKTLLPLLIRQYPQKQTEKIDITVISMKTNQPVKTTEEEDVEDDDEEEKYNTDVSSRDQIIEHVVYISQQSMMECVETIAAIFKQMGEQGQADDYVCECVLQFLYQYLGLIQSLEEQQLFNAVAMLTLEIIKTPLIFGFAQKYPSIVTKLCKLFIMIRNKEMALEVFNICLFHFSDNDFVMEPAIEVASSYHFDLISEIQHTDKLSTGLIELLVHSLPSPAYLAKAGEFIQSDDIEKNKEAASIIKGFLLARTEHPEIEFDVTPFVTILMQKQLFFESFAICFVNPDLFLGILNEIGPREFASDVRNGLIEEALKSAVLACFAPITQIVLSLIKPEELAYPIIVDLIADLFQVHKKNTKDEVETAVVSDQSLVFLISLIDLKFKDSSVNLQTAVKLLDSLLFYLMRVLPVLTDEFWVTLIQYFTCERIINQEKSLIDIFYHFARANAASFHDLFVAVVNTLTNNAEELFAYLVEGLEEDKSGYEFQNRFICVYKAIGFYKVYS